MDYHITELAKQKYSISKRLKLNNSPTAIYYKAEYTMLNLERFFLLLHDQERNNIQTPNNKVSEITQAFHYRSREL